jgi:hypothetical protein
MANISLYNNNVLQDGSQVTATGVDAGSNVGYIYDDRVSFKFVTAGSATRVLVDQPNGNVRDWRYVSLIGHNLNGGTVTVSGYASSARTSPSLVFSSTVSSSDPMIFDSGSTQSYQFFDVFLNAASEDDTISVGEILVTDKFDSPIRPGIGISTTYIPRKTFIILPNGERQAIQHAGVARRKLYSIGGMTLEQADEWITVFSGTKGTGLVILQDDRGEVYPALMNEEMTLDDQALIVGIDLTFEEIAL